MTMLMPQIAARMFDTPLMIDPGKAVAMLMGLGGRIVDGGVVLVTEFAPVEHYAGRVGDRLGRAYSRDGRAPYDVVDNVAVIPIEGTLVHKGAWIGQNSGETSYQGIQTQVAAAKRDPMVKGVVFEVDSMGGQVAGGFETANAIHDLSQAKPTMAILTDFALSGGYLLGSASRQMVVPETGAAGSIGVIAMHTNLAAAAEMKGMEITIISSGAHKADGNSLGPLPDSVRADIQSRLDATRDLFATTVGRFRGGRLNKQAALATEARVFDGRDAVAAGLADAVGSANDAFDAFRRAVNQS